jgi:hypothetical protein
MSEAVTINDVVSHALGGDAGSTRSAIKDVIQQKVMMALEDKKKSIASTFLNKKEAAPSEKVSKEEPTQEVQAGEVENG